MLNKRDFYKNINNKTNDTFIENNRENDVLSVMSMDLSYSNIISDRDNGTFLLQRYIGEINNTNNNIEIQGRENEKNSIYKYEEFFFREKFDTISKENNGSSVWFSEREDGKNKLYIWHMNCFNDSENLSLIKFRDSDSGEIENGVDAFLSRKNNTLENNTLEQIVPPSLVAGARCLKNINKILVDLTSNEIDKNIFKSNDIDNYENLGDYKLRVDEFDATNSEITNSKMISVGNLLVMKEDETTLSHGYRSFKYEENKIFLEFKNDPLKEGNFDEDILQFALKGNTIVYQETSTGLVGFDYNDKKTICISANELIEVGGNNGTN